MDRIEDFWNFCELYKNVSKEEVIEAYLNRLSEKYKDFEYCANCKFLDFVWNSEMHICRRYPAVQSKHLYEWCGEWKRRVKYG